MKKNSIEFNITICFAAVVFLLLVAGGQMYRSIQEYRDTLRWVEHTHQVIRALNQVTSTMRELESGQQAYVITGDEAFRAAYKLNKDQVISQVSRVEQLTVDNPQQHARSAVLLQLSRERLRLLEKLVTAYHSDGFEAARDLIRSGVTRRSMETMVRQVETMENAELSLLKQRSDQAEQKAGQALRIATLLVAITMAGLFLLWRLVKHETKKRQRAEEIAGKVQTKAGQIENVLGKY